MGYFSALVFVLQIIRFSEAELKLEIYKNFNGTEVPISDVLSETVGTHVLLTCKLARASAENSTSSYFDSELSWGWNRANVQFQNLIDLKMLANMSSNPLLQFLHKSDLNQTTIAFDLLSLADSVKIEVVRSNNLRNYNLTLRSKRSHERGSVLIPKNYCTTAMFICNSRTSCVNYEYVCDSVQDCTDGSDENEYICGSTPCKDKTKCSNSRCIPQSLCCDYNQNRSCIFAPGPSCCSEIIRANKATYISSNNIAINTIGLKNDEWTTYRRGTGGGEHNNWNDFSNPASKNSYGSVTRVNYNPKLNGTSASTSRSSRKKFLWILLSPVIVIMVVIGTLAKMWQVKCTNVANTENINHSFSTDVNPRTCGYGTDLVAPDADNQFRHLDLPPSYEEATR